MYSRDKKLGSLIMIAGEIRDFDFQSDYQRVVTRWKKAGEGIQLRKSDEPEEIFRKIKRDPNFFWPINYLP